ncbi:VTT domain-containing protein [Candidatus Bathyarchaeota archaeon]|nr:VTT domain-containing protein [Candidatus Bathyarchaeota archaeon]
MELIHIQEWLFSLVIQYGYLGVFLISLIGALSIVIPIPYTVLIFTCGHYLDPVLVALVGGVGSALGEIAVYALGYAGRIVTSEERKRKMDYFLRLFIRHGAITVFIFALTPLPDDLLFIPLGIMRYSFFKAFIPCLLGKILMCFLLAYGGRLSIDFVEEILGGSGEVIITIASTILLVVIVFLLYRIDWEKYFPFKEEQGNKT